MPTVNTESIATSSIAAYNDNTAQSEIGMLNGKSTTKIETNVDVRQMINSFSQDESAPKSMAKAHVSYLGTEKHLFTRTQRSIQEDPLSPLNWRRQAFKTKNGQSIFKPIVSPRPQLKVKNAEADTIIPRRPLRPEEKQQNVEKNQSSLHDQDNKLHKSLAFENPTYGMIEIKQQNVEKNQSSLHDQDNKLHKSLAFENPTYGMIEIKQQSVEKNQFSQHDQDNKLQESPAFENQTYGIIEVKRPIGDDEGPYAAPIIFMPEEPIYPAKQVKKDYDYAEIDFERMAKEAKKQAEVEINKTQETNVTDNQLA